jgi:hypothetical protein
MSRSSGTQPPHKHERDTSAAARSPVPPEADEQLDTIDEESAESFPASDPPSTSVPTTLGGEQPPRRES